MENEMPGDNIKSVRLSLTTDVDEWRALGDDERGDAVTGLAKEFNCIQGQFFAVPSSFNVKRLALVGLNFLELTRNAEINIAEGSPHDPR
jgi:hypothetical protein